MSIQESNVQDHGCSTFDSKSGFIGGKSMSLLIVLEISLIPHLEEEEGRKRHTPMETDRMGKATS